jgi:hypothetical protein
LTPKLIFKPFKGAFVADVQEVVVFALEQKIERSSKIILIPLYIFLSILFTFSSKIQGDGRCLA